MSGLTCGPPEVMCTAGWLGLDRTRLRLLEKDQCVEMRLTLREEERNRMQIKIAVVKNPLKCFGTNIFSEFEVLGRKRRVVTVIVWRPFI